ncbi:hypothetical protein FQZ97_780360 [compost metagenome]
MWAEVATSEVMDATLTMVPRVLRRPSVQATVRLSTPLTFTAITWSMSSESDCASNAALRPPTPALFTSTPTGPQACCRSATTASHCAASRTSSAYGRTRSAA